MSPSPGPVKAACSLGELIERIRAGSEEAARTLHEQYSRPLLRVIRRRLLTLHDGLRRHIDSTDLLQETWRVLFRLLQKGGTVASEEHLLKLLAGIACNQYRNGYRARVLSARRSLDREEPFDLSEHDRPDTRSDPADKWAAADELQEFVKALPDRPRLVVSALQDGDELATVARSLGIGLRTAQRLLAEARQRWQRRAARIG